MKLLLSNSPINYDTIKIKSELVAESLFQGISFEKNGNHNLPEQLR